jgi:hypothetical protein
MIMSWHNVSSAKNAVIYYVKLKLYFGMNIFQMIVRSRKHSSWNYLHGGKSPAIMCLYVLETLPRYVDIVYYEMYYLSVSNFVCLGFTFFCQTLPL